MSRWMIARPCRYYVGVFSGGVLWCLLGVCDGSDDEIIGKAQAPRARRRPVVSLLSTKNTPPPLPQASLSTHTHTHTHLQRAEEGRQHLAHGVGLAHRAAAPVELAEDVAAARVLGDQVDAGGVLEGGEELEHVRVVERAVDAHLALHLVVVERAQLAAVVHLDRDLHARRLADREVHRRRVAAAQLLRDDKLVDRPVFFMLFVCVIVCVLRYASPSTTAPGERAADAF